MVLPLTSDCTVQLVQNFRRTKLSRLGHLVSIRGKPFTFASKQRPQVPKHFEICGITFAIQAKTAKLMKVFEPRTFYTTVYVFLSVYICSTKCALLPFSTWCSSASFIILQILMACILCSYASFLLSCSL